jgi:hypothetical protein
VLDATGAEKVDLVGNSEGTHTPQYWLKFLGGAKAGSLLEVSLASTGGQEKTGGLNVARSSEEDAMSVMTEHSKAEEHKHTHGPGCGHESIIHEDHVDYLHDGHFHHEHDGHYDECTKCQCNDCTDSCAKCDCSDCTCPTCNHNTCSCSHCQDSCANCACDSCDCATCKHAA